LLEQYVIFQLTRNSGAKTDAVLVFCSPPEGAICLTCSTHLSLGDYGAKPAVVPRRKKKRKKINGGTPAPGE
jgi:hypothetical protein